MGGQSNRRFFLSFVSGVVVWCLRLCPLQRSLIFVSVGCALLRMVFSRESLWLICCSLFVRGWCLVWVFCGLRCWRGLFFVC